MSAIFTNTHPGPTGRGGIRYPVLGVDRKGDPDDANYILCGQCGFPVLLTRDQQGNTIDSPGLSVQGVVTKIVPTARAKFGTTVTKQEAVVQSGCPNCGSYNAQLFNKFKPYAQASYQRALR